MCAAALATLVLWVVALRLSWWWELSSDSEDVYELRFADGCVQFFHYVDADGKAPQRMSLRPHRDNPQDSTLLARDLRQASWCEMSWNGGFLFRWLTIPLWLLSAAFAAYPLISMTREYLMRRRAGGTHLACTRCEYDLTGNTSGVCPECGMPVSAELNGRDSLLAGSSTARRLEE
jgi:hypothetical protein